MPDLTEYQAVVRFQAPTDQDAVAQLAFKMAELGGTIRQLMRVIPPTKEDYLEVPLDDPGRNATPRATGGEPWERKR